MTNPTPKQGLFFALEGLDGSGKTTQLTRLTQALTTHIEKTSPQTPSPWQTQEPTKSPIGIVLRDILTGKIKAPPPVVSALFATDRLHHILEENTGILARLSQGQTVLTDRYYFSSYAYHSVDQDLHKIIAENKQNADLLRPTATLYLDISPEQAMSRINENRDQTQIYESLDFLKKVHDNYHQAFHLLKDQEKIHIISATQSPEQVTEELKTILLSYL